MNTYAEWFASLKVGDEVRVRFPWDDYTFKDGYMCEGVVKQVNVRTQKNGLVKTTVLVDYDRHGDGTIKSQLFFEGGDGGPYMHLEHPTITSIHTIDGYVFPDEISK